MASSPWGAIQQSDVLARGVRWVSTAGHGGYMITERFAARHLSKAAQAEGLRYGDYLCYEEDCDWAIVELEVPAVRQAQLAKQNEYRRRNKHQEWTEEQIMYEIVGSLRRWKEKYIEARKRELGEAA